MLVDKELERDLKVLIIKYLKYLLKNNCEPQIILTEKEFENTINYVMRNSNYIFEELDEYIFQYIEKLGDEENERY